MCGRCGTGEGAFVTFLLTFRAATTGAVAFSMRERFAIADVAATFFV
jgi:hypothetical protein